MGELWWAVLAGLLLAGTGLWQFLAPLDSLWAQQERYWQARGLTPERTELWEEGVRRGGCIFIGFGVVILFGAVVLKDYVNYVPVPMAGVTIDGRALTQKEWDACHHDAGTCMGQYALTHGR